MKRYILILGVFCLALSACASNKGTAASLAGYWKLTAYGPTNSPTPAVPDTEAGLMFNGDGTLTGNSGCNSFGGNYKVEGDQVTFDQIVSTLMACDDPRMAQEEVVHKVLTRTATFKIAGNTLTLTNHDLTLILEARAGK